MTLTYFIRITTSLVSLIASTQIALAEPGVGRIHKDIAPHPPNPIQGPTDFTEYLNSLNVQEKEWIQKVIAIVNEKRKREKFAYGESTWGFNVSNQGKIGGIFFFRSNDLEPAVKAKGEAFLISMSPLPPKEKPCRRKILLTFLEYPKLDIRVYGEPVNNISE